jgi:hypothetical protein
VACGGGATEQAAGPAAAPVDTAAPDVARLGALLPLRRALADGGDSAAIEAAFFAAPDSGLAGEVVRLWRVQQRLWRSELAAAEELLAEVPTPPQVPLGDLLRGRLAFLRSEAAKASLAYEDALSRAPDYDGLRLEMLQAMSMLEQTGGVETGYDLLGEMGSRFAEVYYGIAQLAALAGDEERGEEAFRIGWALRPVERSDIFENPLLSFLCARPSLFGEFDLGSPVEPEVEPPAGERYPVTLPRGAGVAMAGQLLRIEVGDAWIHVPGGWELAPDWTPLEDAEAVRRREEDQALAQLPILLEAKGTSGLVAHPRSRRQALDAALALARQRRWEELALLTDGLAEEAERIPPALGQLRAAALHRLERDDEAKVLLVVMAKNDLANRRRDPGNLISLAELFAASEDFELAIKLLKKAGSLSPYGTDNQRIRQLTMEQELATAYKRWQGNGFDIRFPRVTGEDYPRELGVVLAEERKRLRRWIPNGVTDDIEVSLFPLADFLAAYSGNVEVIGIFDGKLRVPFAEIQSLHPALVRIFTHELAHAMIAEATDDQAPHWFQEGLAQHVEMGTGPVNPFPDLNRTGRVLSFPMVDAVLRGFSEPQLVDLAYSEAAWAVHYIEANHGVGALHRLMNAFAEGLTTEEALPRALGMTVEEFDEAAWKWCIFEAPGAWTVDVRRYDQEYDSLVKRSIPDPPERRASTRAVTDPNRDKVAASPQAFPAPPRLDGWYSDYAEKTQEAKKALAPVVRAVREGQWNRGMGGRCEDLVLKLSDVLRDPTALSPPDRRVAGRLRGAYEGFTRMAQACRWGDLDAAKRELTRAEQQLGQAAAALEGYGLKP